MSQSEKDTFANNEAETETIQRDINVEDSIELDLKRRLLKRQQPSNTNKLNNVFPMGNSEISSDRLNKREERNSKKKKNSRELKNNTNNNRVVDSIKESNSSNRREKVEEKIKQKVKKQAKQQVKEASKKAAKKVAKKTAIKAIKKAIALIAKKAMLVIIKIFGAISVPILIAIGLAILVVVILSMISSLIFSSAPADQLGDLSQEDKDTKALVKQLSESSYEGTDQWMYRLPEELLSSVIQLDSWKDGKDLSDFDPNNISFEGIGSIIGGGSGASAEDSGNYPTASAGQWMTFEATGYYGADDPMQGGFCPAVGCNSIGFNFSESIRYKGFRIVAVDPRVIPLWSIVEINVPSTGLHVQGIALDTGGAIKGRKIDILHEDRTSAYKFGRRYDAQVRVLRSGKGDGLYPQKDSTATSPTVTTPEVTPVTTPTTNNTEQPTEAEQKKADLVIEEAKKYLGIPYVWGGKTPKGFDCSGLTAYVYNKLGVPVNGTAAMQSKQGRKITNVSELRKGDLLFFQNTGGRTGITHVSIYIGNGQMIEAPAAGQNVKISNFKAGKSFAWATRVLGDGDLSANESADASIGGGSGAVGTVTPGNIDQALLKYFANKLKPEFKYETFTETIQTKTKTCVKKKEGSEECETWESSVSESTREVQLITSVRSWNGDGKINYKKVKSGWQKSGDGQEVQEVNYLQDKQDFSYDYSKLDEILTNSGYQYDDKKMFEMFYEYASGLPLHYIDWLDGKDISGLLDGDFIGNVIPGSSIPAEFMPIYLAAEKKYGTPWYILAAVHYHESSFSQNTGPSQVGARGPMQFMPATWIGWKYPGHNSVGDIPGISDKDLSDEKLIKKYGGYGLDANGDGKADIMDNHDSIHAAAKYLSELKITIDPQNALAKYGNSKDYAKKVYDTAMKFKSEATYQQDQGQLPTATSGDWMVPTQGTMTSGFGNRPQYGYHYGIDIAKKGKVPVVAAADGVVFRSYLSDSYGHCVMIRHNVNGVQYESVYAHLTNRAVNEGTQVKKGQYLGNQGATGQAYGQHLHFEIHQPSWNVSKTNAKNPLQFIKM